jgi:hypothetical protein
MAVSGIGLGLEMGDGSTKTHHPYGNVQPSLLGNPAKRGAHGSFPLDTRARAIAAESYKRYLPPARRPAIMKKIHQIYPDLPGVK